MIDFGNMTDETMLHTCVKVAEFIDTFKYHPRFLAITDNNKRNDVVIKFILSEKDLLNTLDEVILEVSK